MSQTVREIAAEVVAAHKATRDAANAFDGLATLKGSDRRDRAIQALAAHVLASTEPRESLDGLGRRIKELTEVVSDLRDQLKTAQCSAEDRLRQIRQIAKQSGVLRAQLQAATMRAEAAEGDTRMMDELQAKCGALLMDVAAAKKERDVLRRAIKREYKAQDEAASAPMEYWQNRAKYWKDRGAQFIEAASQIGVVFSKRADGIKADNPSADERGREVERLRAALCEYEGRIRPMIYGGWSHFEKSEELKSLHIAILQFLATPAATPPAHVYISTACQHGLHDRCRKACKFCGVGCACSCHTTDPKPPAQEKRLPLAAELTGSDPDFTGTLSTEEHIREMRAPAQEHPDTARLDWLHEHEWLSNDESDESLCSLVGGWNWSGTGHPSLRAAIDAARTAPEAQR